MMPLSSATAGTPRAVHATCLALLLAAGAGALLSRGHGGIHIGTGNPSVEPALVAQVDHRIDPNVATSGELAALPGIGETLGKRIVTYRDERIAAGETPPVFRCVEDLDPIKGLGPKLLARLAPHLRFAAPEAASVQ